MLGRADAIEIPLGALEVSMGRIAAVGRTLVTVGKLVAVVWAGYVVLWAVTTIQDNLHIAPASGVAPALLSGFVVGVLCTALFGQRGAPAVVPLSWIAPTSAWFWRGIHVMRAEYKLVGGQLVPIRHMAPAYGYLVTMLLLVTVGSIAGCILGWLWASRARPRAV